MSLTARATPVGALMAALCLVGCRSNETIARESFGRELTCPDDRITVTQRKDLVGADLAVPPETPPKDIAADPGGSPSGRRKRRGAVRTTTARP